MNRETIIINSGRLIALTGIGRSELLDDVGIALQSMKKNGYWIDEKICQWAIKLSGE